GLVAPAEFVPVLEDTGLIVRVGAWVIQAACRQIAEWRDSEVGPVHVAVNVSSRQFAEGDLEGEVTHALARHAVAPELLELELTESMVMHDVEQATAIMAKLKGLGVQLSIDDFGTGYSSLAYLRHFPIDVLKIDKTFVSDITHSDDDAAIVRAIISLAHSLRLKVIAEGVETAQQLAFLRQHGCDQMQGYLFSLPLAAPAFEALLREGSMLPA
ncbi:MAG: EAL domain-containing protein, partial [Janthinobacterium sp.]